MIVSAQLWNAAARKPGRYIGAADGPGPLRALPDAPSRSAHRASDRKSAHATAAVWCSSAQADAKLARARHLLADRSVRPHWTAHCRLCAIFTLYVVHAARLRVVGATLCMQTQTHPTARKMKRFPETHVEPMRELVIHRELPHAGVSTATLHACLTITSATTEPRRAPLARKQRCW